MEIHECILTKNDCYKAAEAMSPVGIIVHSTGADNPYLKRYVQPDDGILGENRFNNSWNRPGLKKCVHAFIGKAENGEVLVYKTLPYDYAAWGVGRGRNGSFNYNPVGHLQFEICQDDLTNEDYFKKAFDQAALYCAYLCKEFNLPVESVISHKEAYELGYGSNHGDPENWLKVFGYTMDDFRSWVDEYLNREPNPCPDPEPTPEPDPKPTPEPEEEFEVGDRVILNGYVYADSYGNGRGQKKKNYKTSIALVAKDKTRKCPYNVFGKSGQYLGWVTPESIMKY